MMIVNLYYYLFIFNVVKVIRNIKGNLLCLPMDPYVVTFHLGLGKAQSQSQGTGNREAS